MGRKLRRVPLDFSWPLDKVWEGFLNPYYGQRIKCVACGESGFSPQAKLFNDQWYGYGGFDPGAYGASPLSVDHPAVQAMARRNCEHILREAFNLRGINTSLPVPEDVQRAIEMHLQPEITREAHRLHELFVNQWSHHLIQADVDALIAKGRLMDFTHVPRNEDQTEIVRQKVAAGGNSWLPESNGYVPTADEVNAWSLQGMGHDSINQWACVTARCKREGVPELCDQCAGHGYTWPSVEVEKLYEEWTESEPPTGDGYQLWETTSEGSPQSLVFETLDELCQWCETHATTFGSFKTGAVEWRKMLDAGFVHHTEGRMVFF